MEKSPAADHLLTAADVAARLGVTRQTLYAYVSRGLLRSTAAPDDPRRSLYDARDVAALLQRHRRGRARRAVAAGTTDFGEPILRSSLTRIDGGRFFYRGQDAVILSRATTLEQTAALLWNSGELPAIDEPVADPSDQPPFTRCLRSVAELATRSDFTARPDQVTADATRLLRRVAQAAAGARFAPGQPIHSGFATAWSLPPDTADLLRRALVLCADHELNASAYAARVVASTGAALAACVLAGLAALSGPRHGGMTNRVRQLAADPEVTADPRQAFSARLARGETLPGFGHRLYPDTDPRAAELLHLLRPGPPWPAMIDAATALTGLPPTLDVALAALETTRNLPQGGGLALFATGRTAGWIAHALEQRTDGRLIRPRAGVG
jgi:citrate synthase